MRRMSAGCIWARAARSEKLCQRVWRCLGFLRKRICWRTAKRWVLRFSRSWEVARFSLGVGFWMVFEFGGALRESS